MLLSEIVITPRRDDIDCKIPLNIEIFHKIHHNFTTVMSLVKKRFYRIKRKWNRGGALKTIFITFLSDKMSSRSERIGELKLFFQHDFAETVLFLPILEEVRISLTFGISHNFCKNKNLAEPKKKKKMKPWWSSNRCHTRFCSNM